MKEMGDWKTTSLQIAIFLKVELGHVDDDQYIYVPVREVMRCVRIEMV